MTPLAHALLFASGSAVSVDFDLTFVAQFVLFATFVQLMRPMLFEPLLRVFEERERRTDGAKQAARAMDERAGELGARYDEELDKIRRTASVERERLRGEASRLEAQIMADARAETARILDAGKARISAEVAQMRRELESAKPELAAEIASRVLGREVGR